MIPTIPNDVPNPNEQLPEGVILVQVEGLKTDMIHDNKNNVDKLVFRLTSRVLEPAEVKGRQDFQMFFIGSNDDPNGEKVETWRENAKYLRQFVEACGVPFGNQPVEQVCNEVVGKSVLMETTKREGKDPQGTPTGVFWTRVNKWLQAGTAQPFLKEESGWGQQAPQQQGGWAPGQAPQASPPGNGPAPQAQPPAHAPTAPSTQPPGYAPPAPQQGTEQPRSYTPAPPAGGQGGGNPYQQ